MTGNLLEFYVLTYYGNINKGVVNYNDVVKSVEIEQSAAKLLSFINMEKVQRLSVGRSRENYPEMPCP
ncbi:hypothetical protein GCM10008931_44440 [Oceanobacillus oncorhynchi subsp. oncorhynchi]